MRSVLAAAVAAVVLLAGCAGASTAPEGQPAVPSAAEAAVLDAYAQLQAAVDAAVQAGGPTAVETALAASTAQVVKESDMASVLGRELALRIAAAGSPAPVGCALLWVRDGSTFWRGYPCRQPGPVPEVDLPEGHVPPAPSPPVPNGPLTVGLDAFAGIVSGLPPVVTALEAYAQLEAGMRVLSGSGPLPRLEAQVRAATDGSIDVAVAAFSYSDRKCFMATRLSGAVEVWKPAKVLVQPGEGSCSSEEAMFGLYKHPPH